MTIRFGSAGAPEAFYVQGHKSSLEMPKWLADQGLNAYEYQCSRGVRIKEEMAVKLGELARQYDIRLSIHAPYYINLSTRDLDMRERTKGYLMNSLRAARWMGAKTVVFHPGGSPGEDRRATLERAKICLQEVLQEAAEEGLDQINLAPETMGKQNQMGSLAEILEFCGLGSQLIPCVDFGHLHAVNQGSLNRKEDFAKILDKIAAVLGETVLKNLHVHFSPIEFTKAGEKKHRTLLESEFGPPFAPLAELLAEKQLSPVIICESQGRQAEDALIFQEIYKNVSSSLVDKI